MKRICFPATFRGHLARQSLLLDELRKDFEVAAWVPNLKSDTMSVFSILCAIEFNNHLSQNEYDAVLIRGDRYEMLGLAMVAAYKGLKIIHIEGGDLSGAIDNKVRHAITNLSDYHFCTNEESHSRLISAGVSPDTVWNYGSLDSEFAKSVKPKQLIDVPYILVAYHPVPDENADEVQRALLQFSDYKIVNIVSNKDYGKLFGHEEYSPEDYINLIRFASCCVGNSSSFLKEASILGTRAVNIGSRQDKRLKPKTVLDVPCKTGRIYSAMNFQLETEKEPDLTYYKQGTSHKIAIKLKEVL